MKKGNRLQQVSQSFEGFVRAPFDNELLMENENRPSREELARYKRLLEKIPTPNCGRIQELRDKIKDGTLLTKEAIEETILRLAQRFLGKE